MFSELERRTAIIVALRYGRVPKEIIDFFKFLKATVYSIAKSFKESEDIKEGFLTPERKTPDRSQVRKRCLENLNMFWSKEFWPPAALTSTPVTTTCGASLRRTLTSVLTTLWTP
ncbi:Uncharacterized protein FKW44_020302 [Caligus rogercresseyi]|uniref:Uncharacterized protein n=1 Tax=Caligus rogercresseyi TaxID=217165 RepID=A0A7T8GX34_CALRO|nr:Uncharacterized protein FKW44_020302 [Caligus rogercresseyi]